MEFLKIKETCLYAQNLTRLREFYEGKLGLRVIADVPGKHLFFRVGESVLLFFNPEESKTKSSPPPHYGGGRQHFAFEVEPGNYEQTKQEILAKGISITDEVTWKSNVKSFYFEDPEGNVLEVVPKLGIWD